MQLLKPAGKGHPMTDLDIGSLELILSQSDLDFRWGFSQPASGNEPLKTAPKKANFYWKRGDQMVHSIEVSPKELNDLIQTLEAKGAVVPEEFHDALRTFPK
jgi:hypothetical protein